MFQFEPSRLKVKRANKHISDLHEMLSEFAKSDFYKLTSETNVQRGINFLRFDIDKSGFPLEDAALIMGDALHNMRSSLDLLYYQIVLNPTNWTRFPIFASRDELINKLNSAVKQKQITVSIQNYIFDNIKPYKGGNPFLWGLHDLNITDKHQIIIPVIKLMMFSGIHLEDENNEPIGDNDYIADESCSLRLRDADDREVVIKDKGRSGVTILFNKGISFEVDPVVPTLKRISEEVKRTVDEFEIFLNQNISKEKQ